MLRSFDSRTVDLLEQHDLNISSQRILDCERGGSLRYASYPFDLSGFDEVEGCHLLHDRA